MDDEIIELNSFNCWWTLHS